MKKFVFISFAVAVLIGLVSTQETALPQGPLIGGPSTANPASTGKSPVPSYASPAAQAKINEQFAAQFGMAGTPAWGGAQGSYSPEAFLNQFTGGGIWGNAEPAVLAQETTATAGAGLALMVAPVAAPAAPANPAPAQTPMMVDPALQAKLNQLQATYDRR
jgi:hypothetical protein